MKFLEKEGTHIARFLYFYFEEEIDSNEKEEYVNEFRGRYQKAAYLYVTVLGVFTLFNLYSILMRGELYGYPYNLHLGLLTIIATLSFGPHYLTPSFSYPEIRKRASARFGLLMLAMILVGKGLQFVAKGTIAEMVWIAILGCVFFLAPAAHARTEQGRPTLIETYGARNIRTRAVISGSLSSLLNWRIFGIAVLVSPIALLWGLAIVTYTLAVVDMTLEATLLPVPERILEQDVFPVAMVLGMVLLLIVLYGIAVTVRYFSDSNRTFSSLFGCKNGELLRLSIAPLPAIATYFVLVAIVVQFIFSDPINSGSFVSQTFTLASILLLIVLAGILSIYPYVVASTEFGLIAGFVQTLKISGANLIPIAKITVAAPFAGLLIGSGAVVVGLLLKIPLVPIGIPDVLVLTVVTGLGYSLTWLTVAAIFGATHKQLTA